MIKGHKSEVEIIRRLNFKDRNRQLSIFSLSMNVVMKAIRLPDEIVFLYKFLTK